jgi:hypothetical protein
MYIMCRVRPACVCVLTRLRQSPNKLFDPTRLIRAELADTIKLDTPRVTRTRIEILFEGMNCIICVILLQVHLYIINLRGWSYCGHR